MDLFFDTLPNGMRLVHHRVKSDVAHCGVIINAGSRDERPQEHGMAHFVEHMLFKGTKKRKPYHILSRLEDVGGELNAYTTKEETVIHASFLKEHFARAIELMGDILANPAFPEKEIKKEKEVVIEEINSYRDNPAELIFDEFEEQVFSSDPIGRNILGTKKSVSSFNREKVESFTTRNYVPAQMVFCSVGDIPEQSVVRYFRKYFSNLSGENAGKGEKQSLIYQPATVTKKMRTWQTHCIMGNVAFDLDSPARVPMYLLNNILGGVGLNSRLNLSLREKKGYAYNVESNYSPYRDTGIFSIYFGTDEQNLEKSIVLANKELEKLRNVKLGSMQLTRAKNQIKGYLARSFENHESLMLNLGKSLLVFGKIESREQVYSKIETITPEQLMETANVVFEPSAQSMLIYK